jgi:hypothetical protein
MVVVMMVMMVMVMMMMVVILGEDQPRLALRPLGFLHVRHLQLLRRIRDRLEQVGVALGRRNRWLGRRLGGRKDRGGKREQGRDGRREAKFGLVHRGSISPWFFFALRRKVAPWRPNARRRRCDPIPSADAGAYSTAVRGVARASSGRRSAGTPSHSSTTAAASIRTAAKT